MNKRKYTQKEELEDMNTYLHSENQFLKNKNRDLAKALSDTKIEHQKLVQNSLELHERLHCSDVERIKFKEFIKCMSVGMQSYIQQSLTLTEQMTNLLTKVNTVIQSPDVLNYCDNSNISLRNFHKGNQSKTAAVMPMIGGHTILSPTINLPRITIKQLTDMISNNSDEDINNDSIQADEIEFADNVLTNNEDHSDDNQAALSEHSSRRLETMQEEDEEETVTSSPLLSGVFKDVKVYISPLARQHVIQVKSNTSSRKATKGRRVSPNQSPKTLIMRRSSNNSSNTTITQRNESSNLTHESTDSFQCSNNNELTKLTSNAEEYDPQEGSSSMWNNTQETDPAFAIPNDTSTPRNSSFQMKRSRIKSSKTPTRFFNNITKRSKASPVQAKMSNCFVKLDKLSPNKLDSCTFGDITSSESKQTRERTDSPTILEKSRRSSTLLIDNISKKGRRDNSKTLSVSPKVRGRRNVKQVVYKEPTLKKKMRRT